MNTFALKRAALLAAVMLLLVLSAQAHALAQDATPTPPPPACIPNDQTACVQIVFYPSTLVGDLFTVDPTAGEAPTTQVKQSALYVTFANPAPGQTIDVVVKNISDGKPDNGPLYIYPDIAKTVSVPSDFTKTKTITVYPVKKYIRGKVAVKCSPQSVQTGEDVACIVSIDDVAQTIPAPAPTPAPDGSVPPPAPPSPTLAAGQKATFILDPGKHTFKFDLTGANAGLWSPASLTKTVTVSAGSYPQSATASFTKAAHLMAKLSVENWVGDFYVDGEQVGTQAATIDLFVKGNATHKVEVKNITLPGSPLIHPYKDASSTFYAYASSTKTLTVTLTKVQVSSMVLPVNEGTVTTEQYLMLGPSWTALTEELANQSVQHVILTAALNGVNVGDTSPYRRPAFKESSTGDCPGCWSIVWQIPLGKLPAGGYTVHYEYHIDAQVFDGLFVWDPGTYYWDRTFQVVPPQ